MAQGTDPHEWDSSRWLAHLRWLLEVLEARAATASQGLWALLGIDGVLIALACPIVLDPTTAKRVGWLMFAGIVPIAAGAVNVLVTLRPRRAHTMNIDHYRTLWNGPPRADLDASLVDELLQDNPEASPVQTIERDTERKLVGLRVTMWLTLAGLLVMALGVLFHLI
ncbi:hypothetical protein ACFT5B_03795 [Luteimicrobium sp. NPDC057192]|uniref:hypothetical protein n=1 Tax=Luteimicrobium sp. NPDC057192 TaxID=3346042 RepID=UPI00363BF2CF